MTRARLTFDEPMSTLRGFGRPERQREIGALANSKSAKKRIRQNRRRYERNRNQRSRLKSAIKDVVNAEDGDAATAAFKRASALLDRFSTRGLLHRNKAARKKSQLARMVLEKGGEV
jgi:small subunit ribosomal protein S20